MGRQPLILYRGQYPAMKRSEINNLIAEANRFLARRCFTLPPFSEWALADWQQRGAEVREIIECGLGWDITDFGSGDFARCGLLLFTLRNGPSSASRRINGKAYAEKIMIVEPGQVTPMHFHWHKTEDIIVRGGGQLVVELFNSTPGGNLAAGDVLVQMDGVQHRLKAGTTVILGAGESITLEPGVYHKFWGKDSRVLVGEVSTVNDDATDNFFREPVGRFPIITEDTTPKRLLVGDYARWCNHIGKAPPVTAPETFS
jgi:D-lyxose ketol-isomerase